MVPSEPRLQCETLRTEGFGGGGKGYAGPESERGPSSKEQLGESAGHTAILCHFWETLIGNSGSSNSFLICGVAHLTSHSGSAETSPAGAEVLQTSMAAGCTEPLALSTGSS